MKKTRVTFEYNEYDITATGNVINEDNVDKLQWTVHNLDGNVLDDTIIDLICEEATKLLIEEAYNPPLKFMKRMK